MTPAIPPIDSPPPITLPEPAPLPPFWFGAWSTGNGDSDYRDRDLAIERRERKDWTKD